MFAATSQPSPFWYYVAPTLVLIAAGVFGYLWRRSVSQTDESSQALRESVKENTKETQKLTAALGELKGELSKQTALTDLRFHEVREQLEAHTRSDREQFRDLGRELAQIARRREWGGQG